MIKNNKALKVLLRCSISAPAYGAKYNFIVEVWIFVFLHKTSNWLMNIEFYRPQHSGFLGMSLIAFILVGVQRVKISLRGLMTCLLFKIH